VWYQKASAQGINVSSNDNSVRIHMPLGSTPEDFQKTIANLGITNARPATEGDIRVLAENQILALFGTSANGVNIYDPNQNHSGEQRAAQLEKIKEKFGISPEDVTFKTESNGRVRFELSDEKAQALAEKYNVAFMAHHVSDGSNVDLWVNMLSGANPGLLSTYHRFSEGIGGEGASSSSDMGNNAGDYVYMTPKVKSEIGEATGGNMVAIKPSGIFKRLDFWANPGDGWGKRATGESKVSNKAPYYLMENKTGHYSTGIYEILPKDSVPVKDWSHVSIYSQSVRQQVIDKLKAKGIFAINGIPVEDFVLGMDGKPPLDLTKYN
jgi:hypothetical protein